MEIIDSHTHWGPSVTMGTEVTTQEILRQAEQSGVSQIVVFPFPSTALADEEINQRLLNEATKIKEFIPYYYIIITFRKQ
jgi:tyrosine-protein phosphatase YwqE